MGKTTDKAIESIKTNYQKLYDSIGSARAAIDDCRRRDVVPVPDSGVLRRQDDQLPGHGPAGRLDERCVPHRCGNGHQLVTRPVAARSRPVRRRCRDPARSGTDPAPLDGGSSPRLTHRI